MSKKYKQNISRTTKVFFRHKDLGQNSAPLHRWLILFAFILHKHSCTHIERLYAFMYLFIYVNSKPTHKILVPHPFERQFYLMIIQKINATQRFFDMNATKIC
jgi:hypothetical protein